MGSGFYAQVGLDQVPHIYASCVAGMTGKHHYSFLFGEVESHKLFVQTGLAL
jgi:hypothetical protein